MGAVEWLDFWWDEARERADNEMNAEQFEAFQDMVTELIHLYHSLS